MTMLKAGLIGSAFLAFWLPVQAQTIQHQADPIGHQTVTEHATAGHPVLNIDMAALADPRRADSQLAVATIAAPAAVEPAATANGTPPARKRFVHKAGQYEDAPLAALLASAN